MKRIFCLVLSIFFSAAAHSISLAEAFEAALTHDLTYRAARAEFSSTQQAEAMAESALRPQVAYNYSETKVTGSLNNDLSGSSTRRDLDYRAPVQSLSLRLALLNRDASKRLEIARLQQAHGRTMLQVREVELLERLATAWFQRWALHQALEAGNARLEASVAELERARRGRSSGDTSHSDLLEAEAAWELVSAQLQESTSQWRQVNSLLAEITGIEIDQITASPPRVPDTQSEQEKLLSPEPLSHWIQKANLGSPTIAAKQVAFALSEAAVARNSAGHYPRLDLTAGLSQSRNESISALNQSIDQKSIGLQLNVPIYSGGYVNAAVRQAMADMDKADAELLAERQAVTRGVTALYLTCQDNLAKIRALQKRYLGLQFALEGIRKEASIGTASRVDVVISKSKLAQVKADITKTFAEYALGQLKLLLKSGDSPSSHIRVIENKLSRVE